MITLEDIQHCVEDYFELERNSILIKTRKQEIVQSRQIAMTLSYELLDKSETEIGNYFGGKDHATVNYSRNAVSNLIHTEKKFRDDYLFLKSMVEDRIPKHILRLIKFSKSELIELISNMYNNEEIINEIFDINN